VNARSGEPSGTLSGAFCDETERQIGEIWLPIDKQIPEQARARHLRSEAIKNIMLKNTVDGELTKARMSPWSCCSSRPSNRTHSDQSLAMSHGWFMQ
jgi:hypothetical protein